MAMNAPTSSRLYSQKVMSQKVAEAMPCEPVDQLTGQRQPYVPAALERLAAGTSELQEALSLLQAKLAPISRAQQTTPHCAKEIDGSMPIIAVRIQQEADAVWAAHAMVVDMLSTLEI